MKEIIVEIPEYIRQVKLSEARMKTYYELGKKHPKAKKYLDNKKYDWKDFKGRKFLVDLESGERVVRNPIAAGTPRIITINGQKIYNGEIKEQLRAKILREIKDSFKPYIEELDPIDDIESFPLCIRMEIHDTIRESGGNQFWDVDNRSFPYIKAFQDCLTGNKDKTGKCRNKVIIPDDMNIFITQPPAPKFIPVDDEKDRKLVFIIEKEDDERVLKHKGYQLELNNIHNEKQRRKGISG